MATGAMTDKQRNIFALLSIKPDRIAYVAGSYNSFFRWSGR
jgi:hypothetical protein